ncbi:Magnesium transporter MgtE [Candidatus Xenohaliotis californiensis]|uniref:Magnesium transporter MgtE n=1 Tax=Candidatus Xenohaliotis californiensis TaxID=84677 RepID=A0ABM9N7P0_9RICK|nr:Magnesium transporter MgtE [Candidatus Xenohaliotis californiensis]
MTVDIKKIREHHRYEIDPLINEALADALDERNDTAAVSIVSKLEVTDIVDFLKTASTEQREHFVKLYDSDLDPQVLLNMDDALLNSIVEMLGSRNTAKIISGLCYDDIVYIMRTIDDDVREHVTLLLPNAVARMLHFVWSYPKESAGRLIQKDVLAVFYEWSIETALQFLGKRYSLVEDLLQVFVVDGNGCPIGSIPTARLFFSDPKTSIVNIMSKNIKVIRPDMDQEEVAYIFHKHGLISAPVVGKNGEMLGYIALDDVVEVMNTEIEQDIFYLGGISENDMHSTAIQTAKSRFPWLFMNVVMATVTSLVIGFFDGTIEKIVILAVLMPIIASTGGNAGIQSVTVIIRGLVKREITRINLWRVIIKEVFSSLISGCSMALSAFFVLMLLFNNLGISVVFAISIMLVFMFSSLLGTMVPLLLNLFKVDPAIASSIIVTTCTDIASYSIFLGLATVFLAS